MDHLKTALSTRQQIEKVRFPVSVCPALPAIGDHLRLHTPVPKRVRLLHLLWKESATMHPSRRKANDLRSGHHCHQRLDFCSRDEHTELCHGSGVCTLAACSFQSAVLPSKTSILSLVCRQQNNRKEELTSCQQQS